MSVIGMHHVLCAPLDDERMIQRVREMAVYLSSGKSEPLKGPGEKELGRLLRKLRTDKGGRSAEMEWFAENGRLLESMQEKKDKSRLPSDGELPRIQRLMREILCRSDALVNRERLTACVKAFDEIRPLRMREIWMVPSALRTEIMGLYILLARQAQAGEMERLAGEKWARGGGTENIPERPSPAFLERALMTAREADDSALRTVIEEKLAKLEIRADSAVRSEYERQALMKMYLSNAMTTLRMLENLDWQKEFAQISFCEKILCRDPAGTYPAMAETSQAVIRHEVEELALCLDLNEHTIVEKALEAAEEGVGSAGEICYWLHEDDGRQALARRLQGRKMPKKRPPDPEGRRFIGVLLAMCTLWTIVSAAAGANIWAILAAAPVIWYLIDRTLKRILTPQREERILRMRVRHVPEEWRTLVVIPALLPGAEGAYAAAEEIHALACLTREKNIDFLLLGDLPTAQTQETDADADVIAAAQEGIRKANETLERKKCHFLYRGRIKDAEGKYSAWERKRGALEMLNRWLLGEEGLFLGNVPQRPYRFVITLDTGTRLLPDALYDLIGGMAHPLNGKYAILQPRMETGAAKNLFVSLMAGQGGCDTYDCCAVDAWQSMARQGAFGGKGIYDVSRFAQRTEGKIRPNTVLSHDMLEGMMAGCGYMGDVVLYENFPGRTVSWLERMHRWIRGDWQLLSYWKQAPGMLGKYRILSNLLMSLRPVGLMLLAVSAAWGDAYAGWMFAGYWLMEARPFIHGWTWKQMLFRLWLLPAEAWTSADAVIRALWRILVSHKNMLEWKTAQESEERKGKVQAGPFCIAAGLMLMSAWWIPLCLAWLAAPRMLHKIEENSAVEVNGNADMYLAIARDTWRYFERAVGETGLPCDNIQLDPPCPEQYRTSPTNIGLYMTSCVAAWRLDVISEEEMLRRIRKTTDALEMLEKWEGQLYNWYDTRTCKPMEPRYVSSVDGGNLAACLICTAGALASRQKELSSRLLRLVNEMQFEALFDWQRKLFTIGMDVTAGRRSDSCYDLLCSEARILYYVSAMLGKTLCESWKRLSRVCGRIPTDKGETAALLSWSGTMFEYLMPELFLPVQKNSLLGQTRRNVIACQMEMGRNEPFWGVSESGYYALDEAMQYQYQAFGIGELALRGDGRQGVLAPYASLLACEFAPEAVDRNIFTMKEAGMYGEMGFFEAMDHGRVVKSHMSHHQGMIMMAICNRLTHGSHRNDFMYFAMARSVDILLEEKPVATRHLPAKFEKTAEKEEKQEKQLARHVRCAPGSGGHLLYGGGTMLFISSTGAGFCRRGQILMNRRGYDRNAADQGFFMNMRLDGREVLLSGDPQQDSRAVMDAGFVEVITQIENIEARLCTFLSPEDGALCRQLTLCNRSEKSAEVEITDAFAVALAQEDAYNAHPAFQNLFVSSSRLQANALLFERTPRNEGEKFPVLVYSVANGEGMETETDLYRLTGRRGPLAEKGIWSREMSGSGGYTLNPCAAARVKKHIPGNGTTEICFSAVLTEREQAEHMAEKYGRCETVHRAQELAQTQAVSMLGFLGVDARNYLAMQRASSELVYPQIRRLGKCLPERRDMKAEELWPLGISGELPIILCVIREKNDLQRAQEALQAYGFYRAMGVFCDLVLLYYETEGYHRPLRDALRSMTDGYPTFETEKGAIRLVDGNIWNAETIAVLETAAALTVAGGQPLYTQWKKKEKQTKVNYRMWSVDDGEMRNTQDGFGPEGQYSFGCSPEWPTPAPWMNLCANENFGMILSERGGGYAWTGSSRTGRLTAYQNDALQEGFAQRIFINRPKFPAESSRFLELSGRCGPVQVCYEPGIVTYRGKWPGFSWEMICFVHETDKLCGRLITIEATQPLEGEIGFEIDWLMGTHPAQRRMTRAGYTEDMIWSRGSAGETAFASMLGGKAVDECTISMEICLQAGESKRTCIWLGCADTLENWHSLIRQKSAEDEIGKIRRTYQNRQRSVVLPEENMNAMLNVWLPCQTEMSRLRGRTGFYQPGGAYGFRDQLQDMLPMIGIDDKMVRNHICLCASHQFEDGDVQHWWHPERLGVRTRISDDMLFLPYVTAQYIKETGDETVLREQIPFLMNVDIPAGAEDWYGTPEVTQETAPLQEHCMRAIRRACRYGEHGLVLMGSGDWNDGMNRVGNLGRGESVWLTEFLLVTRREFMPYMQQEQQKQYTDVSQQLTESLEETWDGEWYLRAYTDDGTKLGSKESEKGCCIDSIPQSWAVFAGLRHGPEAVRSAVRRLTDERLGIIKLLDPPLERAAGTGYICAYPPGVRENGGQYTHAACWLVMALARMGDAEEAWRLFQMLMPYTHADTPQKRERYRIEPYVVAGDIYSIEPLAGRGGWSWYTGAAAWLQQVALRELLGYEKQKNRVRLQSLLPEEWEEVCVILKVGAAEYRLLCRRQAEHAMLDGKKVNAQWITLEDDGQKHTAVFPARK